MMYKKNSVLSKIKLVALNCYLELAEKMTNEEIWIG